MDEGVWANGQIYLSIVRAMGREPSSEGGVGGRGFFTSVRRYTAGGPLVICCPFFVVLDLGFWSSSI